MKSLFAAAAFLLIAVVSGFGQSRRVAPTPTPDDEPVRVLTDEIKLNVLAFDAQGRSVGDLAANDIFINEDNIIHQPSSIRRIPANVLIVLDTGGEMRQVKSLEQTRRTARAVVDALKPGDQIAVMQYSDKAEIVSEWTTDKDATLRAINTTNFGRRSMLVDALQKAGDFISKSGADNRHIVLISDGTDSTADAATKRDAFERLLTTSATVHVISYTRLEVADIAPRTSPISKSPPPKAMPDEVAATLPNGVRDRATQPKWITLNIDKTFLGKMRARKRDLQTAETQLANLAESTNGEVIIPDSLDEMVAKAPLVAKMIDASYVVTYTPKIPVEVRNGRAERNIEVMSKRPGLIVQARRRLVIQDGKP